MKSKEVKKGKLVAHQEVVPPFVMYYGTICQEHVFGEVTTSYTMLGEVSEFTEIRCLNCGQLAPKSRVFKCPHSKLVKGNDIAANQNIDNAEKYFEG